MSYETSVVTPEPTKMYKYKNLLRILNNLFFYRLVVAFMVLTYKTLSIFLNTSYILKPELHLLNWD
jgi:hypothetical protein